MSEHLNGVDNPAYGPDEDKINATLTAALYRQRCPNALELGEYQLGLLAEADQARIRRHLEEEGCPHCLAELGQFETAPAAPMGAPQAPGDEGRSWTPGDGCRWLREKTGELVVRLLAELAPPPAFQFAPVAVKGSGPADEPDLLRRFFIGADQASDLELQVTIRQAPADPEQCTVTVRAEVPSRWPDLAGVRVQATAGDWSGEALSDERGEVTFAGLPAGRLADLAITIQPPPTEP